MAGELYEGKTEQDIKCLKYDENRFNNDVMFLFMYIPPKTWNDGNCMKAR